MKNNKFCRSGGCSAKLGAKKLSKVLSKIESYHDDHLIVGFDSNDDAAVYKIDDDHAFVSTLDFFPPMIDDPYIFGQIAACNALSDVYAMGGVPKIGLNIVCFPDDEDLNILGEIMEGANSKLKEAHVCLAGGHTIRDDSIKYGLSVTGIVDPKCCFENNGVYEEDVLLLTKRLGVGLALNAYRLEDCREETLSSVLKSMTTLNKYALDILKKYEIHALSDVTGFGLLVHLSEMLDSQYSAKIYDVPYFEDVPYFVEEFYLTGAAQNNRNRMENKVRFMQDNFVLEEILFDPQTSGGLLVSVPKKEVSLIQNDFKEHGLDIFEIGVVTKKKDVDIIVEVES